MYGAKSNLREFNKRIDSYYLGLIQKGDGTEASIELGTDNINVATHNGSDKGLKLQGTLLTASATELNQLDNKTVGGSGTTDIPTNNGTASFDNKTIDGGSY